MDVALIERECPADKSGVRKPTVKDKLKAGITNTFDRGKNESTKRMLDQYEHKIALERVKRRDKKARMRKVKQIRDAIIIRPQVVDSNWGIEEDFRYRLSEVYRTW